MSSEIKLPQPISDILDEVARVEEKLARAEKLGAPAQLLDEIGGGLAEFRGLAAAALAAEAQQELKDGRVAAQNFIAGKPEQKQVPPGEDQQRIAAVQEEMERIRAKLALARKHGAGQAVIGGIEKDLNALDRPIREAAVAAARRELREARDELERIERGLPPRQQPPPKGGPGSGGAGGAGGPGGGGSGGSGGSGGEGGGGDGKGLGTVKDTEGKKEALTIYVRSARTIWAWDRSAGAWIPHGFDSDIKQVELISGGLLAVAEHGAALWDTFFGRWLGDLSVPGEELTAGEAS